MPRFWKRKFKKGEFNQEYFQYIDKIVKKNLNVDIRHKDSQKTLLYLVCEEISRLACSRPDNMYLLTLRSYVITLLDQGANPNNRDWCSYPIIFNMLKEIIFCSNRKTSEYLQFQLDIVKLLIDHGGNINANAYRFRSVSYVPYHNIIDCLIDIVAKTPVKRKKDADELFSRIFTFLLDEGAVIESSSPHPQLKRRDLPRCFSVLYDHAEEEPNEEQIRIILS